MQNSKLGFYSLLLMSLYMPAAMAENISIPDKDNRQGMSYQEYSTYRDKMRLRIESRKSDSSIQNVAPANRTDEQGEKSYRGSNYGQGYRARQQSDDRHDSTSERMHDRPRFDKFNRGERMKP